MTAIGDSTNIGENLSKVLAIKERTNFKRQKYSDITPRSRTKESESETLPPIHDSTAYRFTSLGINSRTSQKTKISTVAPNPIRNAWCYRGKRSSSISNINSTCGESHTPRNIAEKYTGVGDGEYRNVSKRLPNVKARQITSTQPWQKTLKSIYKYTKSMDSLSINDDSDNDESRKDFYVKTKTSLYIGASISECMSLNNLENIDSRKHTYRKDASDVEVIHLLEKNRQLECQINKLSEELTIYKTKFGDIFIPEKSSGKNTHLNSLIYRRMSDDISDATSNTSFSTCKIEDFGYIALNSGVERLNAATDGMIVCSDANRGQLKRTNTINLELFKNGIRVDGGPFRSYCDENVIVLLQQLMTGDTPLELVQMSGNNFFIHLEDCRECLFKTGCQNVPESVRGQSQSNDTVQQNETKNPVASLIQFNTLSNSKRSETDTMIRSINNLTTPSSSKKDHKFKSLPRVMISNAGRISDTENLIRRLPKMVVHKGRVVPIQKSIKDMLTEKAPSKSPLKSAPNSHGEDICDKTANNPNNLTESRYPLETTEEKDCSSDKFIYVRAKTSTGQHCTLQIATERPLCVLQQVIESHFNELSAQNYHLVRAEDGKRLVHAHETLRNLGLTQNCTLWIETESCTNL